jgi:hypothetical protein
MLLGLFQIAKTSAVLNQLETKSDETPNQTRL